MNEEGRQVEVAETVEAHARALAHSTRDVPNPPDSYTLLGELTATMAHLAQVCEQLATWHRRTADGVQYVGEDQTGDGATGTVRAAGALDRAVEALRTASDAAADAHSANGVVRWVPSTQ